MGYRVNDDQQGRNLGLFLSHTTTEMLKPTPTMRKSGSRSLLRRPHVLSQGGQSPMLATGSRRLAKMTWPGPFLEPGWNGKFVLMRFYLFPVYWVVFMYWASLLFCREEPSDPTHEKFA